MSEEKKAERTLDDVRNEYSQLCLKAGHIQYQITAMSKDLALVNDQLKELNLEAAKLNAATAAKPEEGKV